MLRILTPQAHKFTASRWRGQTWSFGLRHMASRTCLRSSASSGGGSISSSIASGCLLPPQSRSHPGDPRIALIPPRRVDIAARLLRVSRTGTYARTRTRIACLLIVFRYNNTCSRIFTTSCLPPFNPFSSKFHISNTVSNPF